MVGLEVKGNAPNLIDLNCVIILFISFGVWRDLSINPNEQQHHKKNRGAIARSQRIIGIFLAQMIYNDNTREI
jgi:hypothetical protein